MLFLDEHKLTLLTAEEVIVSEIPPDWLLISKDDMLFEVQSYKIVTNKDKTQKAQFIIEDTEARLESVNLLPYEFLFCKKTPEQIDCYYTKVKLEILLEAVTSETIGVEIYELLVEALALANEKLLAEEARLE